MIGNQIKKSRQERGRRAKKDREGKEMGTGGWKMPAGRKGARERPACKKGERGQRGRAKRVRFPFCAISIVALRLKIMV